MAKRILSLIVLLGCLFLPGSVKAGTYYFQLPEYTINAYWNEDGTLAIDYVFFFANDPSAGYIEYVDIPVPKGNLDITSVSADVDGIPLTDISASGYQGSGVGVAVGLGNYAIPPGETGTVHVYFGKIEEVLYPDTDDSNYVSAVLAPAYFDTDIIYGSTDLTMTFHLPPGVQPEEPRWHEAPPGFPSEPVANLDQEGRIIYTWRNPSANGYTEYDFGASFPKQYVPESAIVTSRFDIGGLLAGLGASLGNCLFPIGCIAFFVIIFASSIFGQNRRKLHYLPPKISIEGHGIKRGLTAVEAAILMEQPVDKILTMILFGVIKKNAGQVITRDPLKLEVTQPLPEDLHVYEKEFLESFLIDDQLTRSRALQNMMVNLIKSVSLKIKGFSRKETVDYYKSIIDKAWAQVEAAETPEVKSQKFDENMEWTMMDGEFEDRTRDVFRQGPVFVPLWWPRYDPGFGRTVSTGTSIPTPGRVSTGSGPALPTLPGGAFAASVVGGVQTFSSRVVGNITEFTGGITQKTNPPPPPSTSSYRSGGSSGGRSCACACACACAGCACACAGGGR